jgi:hypothetical protein
LLLLFAGRKHGAQTFNDDAALWLNVALEKELNPRLSAQLTLQNRINNNLSQYGQGIADAGISYKLSKFFRISGHYRFSENRRVAGTYSPRHQIYATFTARKKFNKLLLIYRNRIQAQVRDIYTSENGAVPEFYDRNKFTARYELNKRFDVYLAQEVYSPFYRFSTVPADRSRSYAGVIYNISKKSSVDVFFLFQRELYASRQLRRDFIYGLTYILEF